MDISIGISASITAYARIYMNQFLQNPNYKVFYTDTDSIVTDKPIDSKYIGTALGQFKYASALRQSAEYEISKGVFLSPLAKRVKFIH